MYDDLEVLPDGSFEEVQTCPFCGSNRINYFESPPYAIKAECGYCGRYIKFVKQWRNHEEWSKQVKERDQYTCQRCGKVMSPREAKAHHKLPIWFMPLYQFDLNNGICLCKECHNAIHGSGGTIRPEASQ